MKRLIYLFMLCLASHQAYAQAEGDTHLEAAGVKDFGGFMLDMGAMLDTPSFLMMPPNLNFNPTLPQGLKVNPEAISLSGTATYTGITRPSPFTLYSLLYPGMGTDNMALQGMTYRFGNGIRLTTYGQYDADGYRRITPSALPWEKNNFQGGFELKSANGKFGVRMEVRTGRNYPY